MSQPLKSSGSLALAGLRRKYPHLRDLDPERMLEVVSAALQTGRGGRELAGLVGRYAAERGCASLGPVQIGPSTWAHRDADGTTQLWHRPPTDAERRACREVRAISVTPTGVTPTIEKPATDAAKRVGRLFK
jgi:hypothetical protein